MTSYKKRKLLRQLQQHSNAIIYSAIFMTATMITVTAAAGRVKKIEYVESMTNYTTEKAVDIEDSAVNKVSNSEDATEAATEIATTAAVTETKPAVKSEYADKFVMNTTGTLNVRKSASANAEIVGKLEENAGGTVLEKGEKWTKIKSGDVEGYVATEYILIGDAAAKKIDKATVYTAEVNADTLNVRTKKSKSSSILGMVGDGEKYKVLSQNDSWVEIEFEGKTGYLNKEFVKTKKSMKTGKTIEEINAEITQKKADEKAEAEAQERARVAAQAEAAAQAEKQTRTVNANANTKEDTTPENTDDTYLLSCLVFCEAGGESYEGKLAVANVVLNRVRAGWGSSIKDVIYAPGQFGPASNGALSRTISNGPDAASGQAARAALSGNNNVSGFCSFGRTGSVNTKHLKSYKIIGAHIFY